MADHEIATAFVERVSMKPNKDGSVLLSVNLSTTFTAESAQYLGRRVGRAISLILDDAQQEMQLEEAAEG